MTFAEIGTSIGQLVEAKNKSYGSAFQHSSELLKLFYPNGVKPEQYVDLLLIARICDKLFRIASKKDAFGETPYKDICGYSILGVFNDTSFKEQQELVKVQTTVHKSPSPFDLSVDPTTRRFESQARDTVHATTHESGYAALMKDQLWNKAQLYERQDSLDQNIGYKKS